MRLICPSCGATHSAEAWSSDADARQCIRIVGEMPWDVSRRALAYIALFRPMGSGLRWSKALRLMSELKDLIEHPHVQWEGKVARPNDPRAWGLAMEQVIEKPPKRLPLKSHGYLRSIAYDMADEMDRKAESSKVKAERAGERADAEKRRTGEPERLSLDEMKRIRDERFGKPIKSA